MWPSYARAQALDQPLQTLNGAEYGGGLQQIGTHSADDLGVRPPDGGQAADHWGDEDVLVEVPGKLELGPPEDAEWISFSAEDSRFEIRVAVYPQATLYNGTTRVTGKEGLQEDEDEDLAVHEGIVTIATIHDTNPNHNPKTPKTKVFNAYFKGKTKEYADTLEEMVTIQIGHLSNDGYENQKKRKRAKNKFRDDLVSTVLLAATNAHKHPSKSFSDERQKLLWWARAMFYPYVLDHDTLDSLSSEESATTKSPLEILQFGCMVEPIRVDSWGLWNDFLSTDDIAKNWINKGIPTKSGGLTCSEDSMIDTLFFNRFPQKSIAHAPPYGGSFRKIRDLILEVSTDRVPYDEEEKAQREAQGTLKNGWTWTMHHQTVTSFQEMFAVAEKDEEERKESRKRSKKK